MEFTEYRRGRTVKSAVIVNTADQTNYEIASFAAKRMGEVVGTSLFGTHFAHYVNDGIRSTFVELYID